MRITTPISDDTISKLIAGDFVLISGVLYTARDAAHLRITEEIEKGLTPPFEFKGNIVFYAGPSPPAPHNPVGVIGPTTSGRMDKYAPLLIEKGLKIMLGKGARNPDVMNAIKTCKGCYLAATGGAAAFLSKHVLSAKIIAYPELCAEAVWELTVEDFPAIVAADCFGGSAYPKYNEFYI